MFCVETVDIMLLKYMSGEGVKLFDPPTADGREMDLSS